MISSTELFSIISEQNARWVRKVCDDYYKPDQPILVSAKIQTKGSILYRHLIKQLRCFATNDPTFNMSKDKGYTMDDVLKYYITKDICTCISYKWLGLKLRYCVPGNSFNLSHRQLLKNLYMQRLGLTDEKTLDAAEKYKLSDIPRGCPPGMTIESNWDFNQRKHKEKLEKRKIWAKEERERKKEEQRKKRESEEGPMPTSNQMKAFKLALQKQFAEKEGGSPTT